jgi:hypothetical protein
MAARGLAPHPEGGYYRETFRDLERTSIDYLLPARSFSAWHRVEAVETWRWLDGGELWLYWIDRDGTLGQILLTGVGEQTCEIGAGWLQAAEAQELPVLCQCEVRPPFEFSRFSIPSRDELLSEWPQHSGILTRLSRI